MADKTAIILGGSAGVGHATMTALLARGYRVGVIARGQARLDAIAAEHGDRVAVAPADVSDAEALKIAVDGIVGRLGKPAVWINCAMLTSFSPFDQVNAKEFQQIIDVTLIGQVNGTRLAMQHMDRGHIVCIGSGLSYRSVPMQAAYCAAKFGINGFTAAVRSELIHDKRPLHLSVVQLPAINTPQFDWARNRLSMKPQPAPPIFQPEVAANAVLKAIDTDAREILVGGSVLQLIFGNMVLPAWLDKKLASDGADMQKSDRPEPGGRPDNMQSPVDYPATAHGSFDSRAKDKGLTVDGDTARYAVFFGGATLLALVAFILGLLVG